jgi:hypothetical protein
MAAKRKTVTMTPTKKGQKTITFKSGGLHAATGTPQDETIPASKMQKALSGGYGPKAKKQAQFAKNVLAKGRRTAAKRKK